MLAHAPYEPLESEMGRDGGGHRFGVERESIPALLHVFKPVAPHEGEVGIVSHSGHVERGWVLVAVHHDDARVGRDAPSCPPLLDVPDVVSAEAAPAEHDE